MAAGTAPLPSGKMTLTISFEGKRLTRCIPNSILVSDLLRHAAEAFKVKPEGLCFLYQGLQVPEQLTVEVCGCWSRDGNLLAPISINVKP